MIKFEFVLEDDEAEGLMEAVQSYIQKLHIHILDELVDKNRQEYISEYKNIIEYYKNIKSKMHNTRVVV